MMRRAFLLGGAMLLVASVADAQTRDPRLSRLDAQTAEAVQALVDSARTLGVPTEPLVDRALQGAARNASGSVTLTAVRDRLALLVQARAALAPATEAEIIAGADAIRSGASPETLGELRRARPSAELTVPIGVLADLIGKGVARDTAAALLLELASMDMEDRELTEFRRMVDRDIALGALPSAAAAIRAEAAGVRNLNAAAGPDAGPTNSRPPTNPRPIPPQRP
jgi:hypothetical protein